MLQKLSLHRSLPFLVLLVAVVLAGLLYVGFLQVDRHLWYNGVHDRNAHYLFMAKLASDLQTVDVANWIRDVDSAKVWPPFQGLVGSIGLLLGGLHYQIAVLPALVGWVLTVTFGFLAARRTAGPGNGNVSGLVFVAFILGSPAHRAYAVDVMLESLGAGLTMTTLYWYLVAVQERTGFRWLGLSLTALFLHKYNYWGLVIVALAADTILRQSRERWAGWLQAARDAPMGVWLRREARQPLTLVFAAAALFTLVVLVTRPEPIRFRAQEISLYPPNIILNVAYGALLLRVAAGWYRGGSQLVALLDPWLGPLVRWHAIPVAVYLLLPKRLGIFLLFNSPANGANITQFDPFHGAGQYLEWMRADYHVSTFAFGSALLLLGITILAMRRLAPGGRAAVLLVLLSFVLIVLHPNQKARFVHSWLPSLWVAAGAGAALLVEGVSQSSWQRIRLALNTVIVGAAFIVQGSGLVAAGHALDGGPHPESPALLELTDYYLPELDSPNQVTVLSAVPCRFMVEWTFLEQFSRLDRLDRNWFGFERYGPSNIAGFRRWVETTAVQTLICLEPGPGAFNWGEDDLSGLHREVLATLRQQREFQEVKARVFPDLACRVSVWKRLGTVARH